MQACRARLLTAASAAVTAPSTVAAADSCAAAAAAAVAFDVSYSALYNHHLLDLWYTCLEQHTLPQEMQ
jgi:hypothetical protein